MIQEIPKTADKSMAPRGRATQQSRDPDQIEQMSALRFPHQSITNQFQ